MCVRRGTKFLFLGKREREGWFRETCGRQGMCVRFVTGMVMSHGALEDGFFLCVVSNEKDTWGDWGYAWGLRNWVLWAYV